MDLTARQAGTTVVASLALATSTVIGLAGHWFAAWLVLLVDGLVIVAWNIQAGRATAETEARIAELRADLERARLDARASHHEARADLELLRAEIAVSAKPDEPRG